MINLLLIYWQYARSADVGIYITRGRNEFEAFRHNTLHW